jgi:predicted component of type VI protein secretion system
MKFLFERLAAETGPSDPVATVFDNMQRLVSTRAMGGGYSAFAEPLDSVSEIRFDVFTCGVPDIVDFGVGDRHGLERYAAHIHALIAHYEPRLRNPHVDIEGVRLVVSGAIDTAEGLQTMRFPVELREDG